MDGPSCPQAHVAQSTPAVQSTGSPGPSRQEIHVCRVLGDQLESGGGKAHLLHRLTVSDQAVTGLIFAKHP